MTLPVSDINVLCHSSWKQCVKEISQSAEKWGGIMYIRSAVRFREVALESVSLFCFLLSCWISIIQSHLDFGWCECLVSTQLDFPFPMHLPSSETSKCKFIKRKTISQLPCTCNGAGGLCDLLVTRSLFLMHWHPRHGSQGMHCP